MTETSSRRGVVPCRKTLSLGKDGRGPRTRRGIRSEKGKKKHQTSRDRSLLKGFQGRIKQKVRQPVLSKGEKPTPKHSQHDTAFCTDSRGVTHHRCEKKTTVSNPEQKKTGSKLITITKKNTVGLGKD